MSNLDEGGVMLPEICWGLMSECDFEKYDEVCLRDGNMVGRSAAFIDEC